MEEQQWTPPSSAELAEIRRYEQIAAADAEKTAAERRRAERVELRAKVTVASGDNFFMGFSENLSEGGVFISTMSPPPVGETIGMQIEIEGGEPVPVEGVVRWHRHIGSVVTGCGVQFLGLPQEAQRYFEDSLARIKKEPLFFEM